MKHRARWFFAAGIAASVASVLLGCAATAKRTTEGGPAEQFLRYAGPPIESFTYLRHYYAWKPLGNLQVALWTDINDAYLLTVLPPCVGLDFARGISVSSTANTITRGVDALKFDQQYCFITQIRHVDYLAMKRELHAIP